MEPFSLDPYTTENLYIYDKAFYPFYDIAYLNTMYSLHTVTVENSDKNDVMIRYVTSFCQPNTKLYLYVQYSSSGWRERNNDKGEVVGRVISRL